MTKKQSNKASTNSDIDEIEEDIPQATYDSDHSNESGDFKFKEDPYSYYAKKGHKHNVSKVKLRSKLTKELE